MKQLSIGHVWTGFITTLFAIGAAYLGFIVIGTIWDVLARNEIISAPLWLGTAIEFGLPTSTMLAAPRLVRERRHVSMELIDSALNARNRRFLITLTDIIAAGISIFIAYYSWLGLSDAWERKEVLILAVDVPRWTFFALLLLGFVMCAIEFLRHALTGQAAIASTHPSNESTPS